MNWRRGLFIVWLVATVAWWIYAFSLSRLACQLTTNTERHPGLCIHRDNLSSLLGGLIWPAIVFALGWIALWLIRRFGAR